MVMQRSPWRDHFCDNILLKTFIFVDFQALSEVERECQKLRKKLEYEVRILPLRNSFVFA